MWSLLVLLLLTAAARCETRVAFVVGVGAYRHVPALPNPPNDARDIAAVLTRLGFDTELLIDPDRAAMEAGVRQFGRRARNADVALFYYAGHALEYGGHNWLIPASAEINTDKDLRFESVDLADISDQLDGSARLSMLFLDACRDNPFRQQLGDGARGMSRGGLADVQIPAGTLLVFSTAPGTVAEDGRTRNSPFTQALLKNIPTPGLEVRQMLDQVRRDVRLATQGRQLPWDNSSMEGQFYFVPAQAAPPAPSLAAPQAERTIDPTEERRVERVFWESVRDSDDADDFRDYLRRYPAGEFADLARRRVARLSGRPTVTAQPAGPPPPASDAAGPQLADQPAADATRIAAEKRAADDAARKAAADQAAQEAAARKASERQAAEDAARKAAAGKLAAQKEAEQRAAAEQQARADAARQAAEKRAADEVARKASERQAAEDAARKVAADKLAAQREAEQRAAEKRAADEAARRAAEQQAAEDAAHAARAAAENEWAQRLAIAPPDAKAASPEVTSDEPKPAAQHARAAPAALLAPPKPRPPSPPPRAVERRASAPPSGATASAPSGATSSAPVQPVAPSPTTQRDPVARFQ